MKQKFLSLGVEPPSRQTTGLIRENVNHCTTSAKLSRWELILILKQLCIDCSWIDINMGNFLWETCSDRCKNPGRKQKIPEGTSSAMFDVRTIAKCSEFKRCTSTRFDVTRVTQVTVL